MTLSLKSQFSIAFPGVIDADYGLMHCLLIISPEAGLYI